MESGLPFEGIRTLSRLIHTRELSPVELVESLLARIEAYNGKLHSYITVCRDRALAEARWAEQEIVSGRSRGQLHGIPVAHKDNIWTRGVRTTAHSLTNADFVPERDATAAARLGAAGMPLLGKANTSEFAIGGVMNHFGFALNPWDDEIYCGVSSSGSAAALAAGLAVAATGSDTGGSIRMPASFCGVVGVKPTYGRVSRFGLIPLSWSQDNIGPMARTVADAALLLGAMAGHDPLDIASSRLPVPDYLADLDRGIDGVVIGVPHRYFYDYLDDHVRTAMEEAHRQLERLGARLEQVDLPLAEHMNAVSSVIVSSEAYVQHAERLRQNTQLYSDRPRRSIAAGAFYSAADLQQAHQLRELWVRQVAEVFTRVEALVMPTMTTAPYKIEVWFGDQPLPPGNTPHFNLAGIPAITVPCGFTDSGLPLGLQVVAKAFDEPMLFRVAHAYEQSTDWHRRRPPSYA